MREHLSYQVLQQLSYLPISTWNKMIFSASVLLNSFFSQGRSEGTSSVAFEVLMIN